MSSSVFAGVKTAPPDVIFGVVDAFRKSQHPNKLNLSVGAYRTNEGKPYVLPAVRQAERDMAADDTLIHEYLPISGLPEFIRAAQELIFGADSIPLNENRIAGVQSLSGTGALRLGAEFLRLHMNAPTVYLSNPTWGNHKAIFSAAGLAVKQYAYYKEETRGLDLEGMIADLRAATPGSVILLHACAHNPTGVDLTQEQWRQVADVMRERKLIPFFDSAYQGYASGSLDDDAFGVRHFANGGFELLVAQSFSKNMGLYGERVGCFSVVTKDQDRAEAVVSQVKRIIRAMYSNPPSHGARVALRVMTTPALRAQWTQQLSAMSDRILSMRQLLFSQLQQLGTPGDWSHIVKQIGMFTYTGLSPEQCDVLTNKHGVYLLRSGRISLAGLSDSTAPYLAKAIDDVVRSSS